MFRTRLTSAFGIEHPIVLAPMDLVADARLAGAVSAAGGLGLLGGGYGDREWLERQLGEVTPGSVGRGFITWSLARRPELLDLGLEHRRPPSSCPSATRRPSPTGSTAPASRCSARSAPWARRTGRSTSARAIVAQGGEAGGHGTGTRSGGRVDRRGDCPRGRRRAAQARRRHPRSRLLTVSRSTGGGTVARLGRLAEQHKLDGGYEKGLGGLGVAGHDLRRDPRRPA